MAFSSFWRSAIVVGSALGIGAFIAVFGRKKGLPPPPDGLESPIDEENCSLRYFPSPNRGDARGKDVLRPMPPPWIVLHDTEGPGHLGVDDDRATAASNAAYFANPEAKVSTQLVVDNTGACYRCVADDQIAWGAGAVNPQALQIEMAAPVGAAVGRTREDWLAQDVLLDTAAAHVAHWCDLYDIPAVFVTGDDMLLGARGITTHAEVTKAFGGSHIDPGPTFPIDEFIAMVRGRGGLFA